MPVSAASASGAPRWAGTRSRNVVAAPRPSPARRARPRARSPSQAPPGCEVPRQLGQCREAHRPPVRPDRSAVHARPTDDADAPAGRRARTRDGERVVAQDDSLGPPQRVDRRRELLLVDGQVDAGQAVHAGRAERECGARQPRVGGDGGDRLGQCLDRPFEADQLVVAGADPGPAEDGASRVTRGGRRSWCCPRRTPAPPARRRSARTRTDVTLRCVGTKVVVVGGGSTYTPELVDGLCDR